MEWPAHLPIVGGGGCDNQEYRILPLRLDSWFNLLSNGVWVRTNPN